MSKPFSQACENNKAHILAVLSEVFADRRKVLEIGGGTGQHACHFAAGLPHATWQPTDMAENLPVLRPRCARYVGNNLLSPLAFDVRDAVWSVMDFDAVFSANTLHIMAFEAVRELFAGLARAAGPDVVLAIYGPFNYDGKYTSDSNARFDQWLAAQHPDSAIRDFEAVDALASAAGFALWRDCAMPANNRLLVWRN